MTRIITILALFLTPPALADVSSDKPEGIPGNVEVNIRIFDAKKDEVRILLTENDIVVAAEKRKNRFGTQMKADSSSLWFEFKNAEYLQFTLSEQTAGKVYLAVLSGFNDYADGIYPLRASAFRKIKNSRHFGREERKVIKRSQNASHVVSDFKVFSYKNVLKIQLGDNMLELMEERELRLAKEREQKLLREKEEREQKLLREKEERARQFARMREACEEYGFQPKTDGLAGCVQRLHSAVLQAEAQQAAAEQRERIAAKQLESMDANAKAARWNAIFNSVIQAGVSTYNTNRQIQNNNFNTNRIISNDNFNNLNRR